MDPLSAICSAAWKHFYFLLFYCFFTVNLCTRRSSCWALFLLGRRYWFWNPLDAGCETINRTEQLDTNCDRANCLQDHMDRVLEVGTSYGLVTDAWQGINVCHVLQDRGTRFPWRLRFCRREEPPKTSLRRLWIKTRVDTSQGPITGQAGAVWCSEAWNTPRSSVCHWRCVQVATGGV